VENAFEGKSDCLTLYASREVLECCQRDLFNDRIWPDFVALSQGERPFLKLAHFEAGQTVEVDGVRITAVALDHVVPTVGYLVADESSTIGFISDTGPTQAIWDRLNAVPNLKAVFLETTFPNHLTWLATVSKHLTPALAEAELKKLVNPVRAIIVHLKARFQEEIIAELQALNLANLEIGRSGTPYLF
jgi:ribonuclease BN (tRNA processing enzyme)